MATQRQIEANRRNAGRSTGPKTEGGKARSRLNATKHGLAGELDPADFEAEPSPEFLDRRSKWAAGLEIRDEAASWALDRAVAASLRVEHCERSLDRVVALERRRALLCWDQDRALEAEVVARSIAVEPALTSKRLQTSLAGVEWLIAAWLDLVDVLDDGRNWSEDQASRAYDLLGMAQGRRVEATGVGLDDARRIEVRREMASAELARLEELRDGAFVPLDEAEQDAAIEGGRALLSKPARLILRYERDAWRRYRESMRPLESPAEGPPAARLEPRTSAPTSSRPKVQVEPDPGPSLETLREESRGLLEELKSLGLTGPDWVGPIPEDPDDAWYEGVERKAEARGLVGPLA